LEAVKFLDQERQISGIGCDTLSPETAAPFPIHVYILGRGKFIVENINNVDKMPPAGGLVSVNIIKFADITEAPARVVGFYVA
jgi:kynurenine formamidase